MKLGGGGANGEKYLNRIAMLSLDTYGGSWYYPQVELKAVIGPFPHLLFLLLTSLSISAWMSSGL